MELTDTLHTGNKAALETGPMLSVSVLQYYKNFRSVGLSPIFQGVISIPRFSDGVSVKSSGVREHWMGFQ